MNNNDYIDGGFNFLFSLNKPKIFSQNDNLNSIYNDPYHGPCFGSEDLTIGNQSNTDLNSFSYLSITYGIE
jgi:hypothetical protein